MSSFYRGSILIEMPFKIRCHLLVTGTELGYKGRQMGCDLHGEVMEFSHEIFRVKGKQNKQEESFLDREKQYYET